MRVFFFFGFDSAGSGSREIVGVHSVAYWLFYLLAPINGTVHDHSLRWPRFSRSVRCGAFDFSNILPSTLSFPNRIDTFIFIHICSNDFQSVENENHFLQIESILISNSIFLFSISFQEKPNNSKWPWNCTHFFAHFSMCIHQCFDYLYCMWFIMIAILSTKRCFSFFPCFLNDLFIILSAFNDAMILTRNGASRHFTIINININTTWSATNCRDLTAQIN